MEFSISIYYLVSFLLFLLMFLKSLTISKSANAYSHIPGPKPLPLIGNLHLMLRAATPHRLLKDLAAAYGPLMHLQLGELNFLVVSSGDSAKQVLRTHDAVFANRPRMLATDELAYNSCGVGFSPHGAYWRQLRKICTAELLSARRVLSFRSIRGEENASMCEWIASQCGSPVHLSERLYVAAYDITTRAAVKAKTGERERVVYLLLESLKLGSGFMVADLFPSVKLAPLITGARFKIRWLRHELDKVLDGVIERHRAAADDGDGDDDAKLEGFLDILLKYEKDGTLTIDNVKALLLVYSPPFSC